MSCCFASFEINLSALWNLQLILSTNGKRLRACKIQMQHKQITQYSTMTIYDWLKTRFNWWWQWTSYGLSRLYIIYYIISYIWERCLQTSHKAAQIIDFSIFKPVAPAGDTVCSQFPIFFWTRQTFQNTPVNTFFQAISVLAVLFPICTTARHHKARKLLDCALTSGWSFSIDMDCNALTDALWH